MKQSFIPILILILFVSSPSLWAQGKANYKVAIFLYDGVELLDFSGPGEVFAATNGFEVYTVSVDGKEIISQGFVTIKPQYAIVDAPTPDIVVYPGGSASASSKEKRVLEWVHDLDQRGAIQMSVCTGAQILAASGLLDGLNVTTWYGFTDRLQEMLPDATVLKDTRYVDSGNIITTAGVSAGIDGALHLVDRIKGKDIAESTARYMEYDNWERNDGQVDFENLFIASIQSKGLEQVYVTVKDPALSESRPLYYEGEMKNLGLELIEQQEWDKAAMVFEMVTADYPKSFSSFVALRNIYRQQNKFTPIDENTFIEMVLSGNPDQAIAEFHKTREVYPEWLVFSENALNFAGYKYLQKKQFSEAIKLFQLNMMVYPDSPNVYDSLGEAYLASGNEELALQYYQKALEFNPAMKSAQNAVETLSSKSGKGDKH